MTTLKVPTAMVFVRAKDGISHSAKEWSSKEDCAEGALTLGKAAQNISSFRTFLGFRIKASKLAKIQAPFVIMETACDVVRDHLHDHVLRQRSALAKKQSTAACEKLADDLRRTFGFGWLLGTDIDGELHLGIET
ncbi:N-carbamoyl-L-amino acid hydrolase, partial [Lachnellula willkommii]